MTVKEYAEKLYPIVRHGNAILVAKRTSFEAGFQLGVEFAEWADENYFRRKTVNGDMWSEGLEADPKYTTPELTELFLNDKILKNKTGDSVS